MERRGDLTRAEENVGRWARNRDQLGFKGPWRILSVSGDHVFGEISAAMVDLFWMSKIKQ